MTASQATGRCAILALAIWLAPPAPLLAQAPSQALPPLTAVVVTGSAACSASRLVAATGLQRGQAVSRPVLQQALQRLADSGEFAKLSYRYTFSPQGTDVQFQVVDIAPLVPLAFDNFVWLPKPQLLRLLRAKIPAFCGKVPLSGGVDRQITSDLQAYLRQRAVTGATVDGMPYQAEVGSSSFASYMISVQGVNIPLQQIAFPGAPAGLASVLRQDAASLMGHNFARDRVAAAVHADFLPELRNRGFLQAKFAAPVVQLTNPATNAVSVSLAVDPGQQYRWGAIRIRGNAAVAVDKLQKLIKVRAGRLADRAALDQDIAAIQKLYGDAGYIQAAAAPTFAYGQPGAAAVTIVIHEGPQFRMGTVSFPGAAGNVAAQLAQLWQLHPGQPYRANYLRQYLKAMYAHFNLQGVKLSTTEALDLQHHLVNVTVALSTLSPSGGGVNQLR